MSRVCHGAKCAEAVPGKTLFDYADELEVHVPTSCNRAGTCHECVVEVRRGLESLSPPSAAEGFLRGAYRLACQATVQDTTCDIRFLPLRRHPQILTATSGKTPELDPPVT